MIRTVAAIVSMFLSSTAYAQLQLNEPVVIDPSRDGVAVKIPPDMHFVFTVPGIWIEQTAAIKLVSKTEVCEETMEKYVGVLSEQNNIPIKTIIASSVVVVVGIVAGILVGRYSK